MIEINDITYRYLDNQKIILENFSCTFDCSTVTVLLGPNGCGKTTLLDIIAGVRKSDSGSILINGMTPSIKNETIGFIFQSGNCLPWLTVEDNLIFGIDKDKFDESKIINMLIKYDILDLRKSYPNQVSGGQKQRIAIARLEMLDANIIFCDEPFGAVDFFKRSLIWNYLKKLAISKNSAIVIVTHNPEEALRFGDVIYLLSPAPMRICSVVKCKEVKHDNYRIRQDLFEYCFSVLESEKCIPIPDNLRNFIQDTCQVKSDNV